MIKGYRNKMMTDKSIKLIPKYIGGVELDFKIDGETIRVRRGDELPQLSIKTAKDRPDFVIIKRRIK